MTMMGRRWIVRSFRGLFVALLFLAALGLALLGRGAQSQGTAVVSGVVRLADGRPATGAWVRSQTTANLAYAAADGSFTLGGLAAGTPITVTAWYPGQKVGWAAVSPPVGPITITLRPYDTLDNPAYVWNTSYPDPANPTLGCGHCMAPAFAEWSDTAHAGSATNRRFFSLYNGTDLAGTAAVPPGYKLDFPDTTGNCATCHAPGAAYDAAFTTDMNALTNVNREGVFCEFCHKVGAVYLNSTTGRPYNNAPGVLSMRLYRPYPGDQLFFGSLDDVTRRVSYLPLEKKSQFCAPCHQFAFWNTPIYQSFREWQESPYAASGVECQTCHMPPGASPTFCLPEKGGLARDPTRLASHRDLGLKDIAFMQSAVALTLTLATRADAVQAQVTLVNVGAGHHVPTDFPGRNLLLVVTATAAPSSGQEQAAGQGQALPLQIGPVVPNWGGDYAGQAGKGYAKILRDLSTGEAPVVNYWKQTLIESDNRIPAFGSDSSVYVFGVPAGTARVRVTARLVFRRVFQPLAERKGWDASDIELLVREIELPWSSRSYFLPLLLAESSSSARRNDRAPFSTGHPPTRWRQQ